MNRHGRSATALVATLAALPGVVSAAAEATRLHPEPPGTVWVANRGTHEIRGFDATTGQPVARVPLRAGSQSGDLAAAKGKLYVSEEFASPPAIAIVDATSGEVLERVYTARRPHHVHASPGGNLVAFGLYGTNRIGVIDARSDTLLGEWPVSDNAAATAHAGVFSPDGRTVYVAVDNLGQVVPVDPLTGERDEPLSVPGAHELAVLSDGKTAYVSSRTTNTLYRVDLERRTRKPLLELPAPDTLRLSANEKLLTVGLRARPARVAVVETGTLDDEKPAVELVTLGGPGTLAGHQWTSPDGGYTFAAYEGPGAAVALIDHSQGNAVVDRLDYPGAPHGVAFTRVQPAVGQTGAGG